MTTLVLGLDGASFELLDPWIEAGRLPAIARLREEGVATDMESVPPPVTCPNWQAYATGRNPGKLGVYWWERVDAEAREIVPTSASGDFDGTHYWRYLDGQAAVVNLPTSYPPPDVDGVHVAGGPGAEQTGYATPAGTQERLEGEYDYAVHPPGLGRLSGEEPESATVQEIYDLIDARFAVVGDMLAAGEYELIHCTIFYVNVLQHFFWDHEVTRRAWELIDDHVAGLLDSDDLETLVVMSDHGSNEIDVSFRINAWLEAEGYLVTEPGVGDVLHRLGLTRERVRPVLGSLGVEWWLRRYVPRRVQTMLPSADGSVTKGAKASAIDWDQSTAVASGQGPVYVIADDPAERSRIRDELVERLDGLTHDGRSIVAAARPAAEVYAGPYLDSAPDVVLEAAPGVHIAESLGGEGEVFASPTDWRAENKRTGLFAAYGDAVDSDADLADVHILDVAPTVLHLHDRPVPTDLDGDVRTELFAADADAGRRAVRTCAPLDDDEASTERETDGSDVTDRLEDLGYLQ